MKCYFCQWENTRPDRFTNPRLREITMSDGTPIMVCDECHKTITRPERVEHSLDKTHIGRIIKKMRYGKT